MGFPDGSVVESLPVMQETQETWGESLGWEDPLKEEIATHSGIPAWRIPWMEEPGGLHSTQGHKDLDTTEATPYPCVSLNFFNYKADVDNSNPAPDQGPQWARWVSVCDKFNKP